MDNRLQPYFLFPVIWTNTLTVMCQGCDLACGYQSEVLEDFERLRGSTLQK